jgi:hypothetical protein
VLFEFFYTLFTHSFKENAYIKEATWGIMRGTSDGIKKTDNLWLSRKRILKKRRLIQVGLRREKQAPRQS